MYSIDYELFSLWFRRVGYEPSPEQEAVHRVLLEARENEDGPIPTVAIVGGGEQSGKHLHVDTPIATVDGWKRMGDLQVGDLVFDETGALTLVEWTSTIQEQPSYLLTFDNGDSIIASATHPWLTQNYNARKHGYASKVRTTKELVDGGITRRAPHNHRPFANWSISSPAPIVCPERELPIPPYVLGAWLGDGTSVRAEITCGYGDLQIVKELELAGIHVTEAHSTNAGSGRFVLTEPGLGADISLLAKLRAMSLFGNKHIPQIYLRSSVEQRKALLRGLMDTDGYVTKRGQMSFCNTNRRIIEGFIELISSFGWSHRVQEKTAWLYGKDCGLVWNVSFQTDDRAFNLNRKIERQQPEKHSVRSERIYITDIEDVGIQPVRCIGVTAMSHLYLAGRTMIPTHNSFCAGNHVFARAIFDELIWLVGERYEDTKKEFEYARDAAIDAGLTGPGLFSTGKDGPWELQFKFRLDPETLEPVEPGCLIKTLSSEDVKKLAREAPDGIVMCEPGRQSDDAFRALLRRAFPHTGWLLVDGTFEEDADGWYPDLWNTCLLPGNPYGAVSLSLPSYANRANYPQGEDDPKWRAALRLIYDTAPTREEADEEINERFRGIPRKAKGVVFHEFTPQVHIREDVRYVPGFPVELAVDPGWSENSAYAILFCQYRGQQIRVFDELYVHEVRINEILAMVKNHACFPDIRTVWMDPFAMVQHHQGMDATVEAWTASLSGYNILVTAPPRFSPEDGLRRLHDKLWLDWQTQQPFLVMSPAVQWFAWELQKGYRYNKHADGSYSTEPRKRNNHAITAMTYLITGKFGGVDIERPSRPKASVRTPAYLTAFQRPERSAGVRR